ncbi:hypothetical protein BCR39DRAFT_601503 [Naematelia encephala]|uniref:Uncharacterized protein n=1 Tax=Naematelia encephala TaxID=71784 RepID=A0A1Y2ACZ9_9TREE|nr:hypothetical protein BCR39DRAFT_601503 [Naematelia encephala]
MSVLRSSRYNPGSVYSAPPVGPHADAWDARPSMESLRDDGKPTGYQNEFSDVPGQHEYANPTGRYEDAYAEGSRAYPNEAGAYDQPQHGQYAFSTPGGGYVDHPPEAYSRDPGQTPTVNAYQAGQGWSAGGGGSNSGGLRMPEGTQRHPDCRSIRHTGHFHNPAEEP